MPVIVGLEYQVKLDLLDLLMLNIVALLIHVK